MNMHMAQNILAETELRHLAAIPYQIVSPATNSPLVGIYQDSMLGCFQFTRPNIYFTPRDAMNLLMMYSSVDTKAIREAGSKISNFQILSQIMKPITLNYKNKLYTENPHENNIIEIRNGQWIRGQIEKSVMASTTKGVLHRIFNDFGPMACANFIDDLQNIITEYMKTCSFSVGISDLIANKTTMESIIQAINKQKIEVQSIIEKIHLGIFENNTANDNMTEFESQVNRILNKATDESGRIGRDSLSKDNRFLQIVSSGSKGNLINISQMISGLGQQNVDGKRIPYGFDSRTLPHYFKYDDSPAARGFIENSYISGLTAPELFFHAMGGRIGLIDTAVKTSQTGYIQRRLIKGLEDIKVEYDMTVRNSKGVVVQFAYGEDGFDTTRVENQVVPLTGMSLEDIYLHYDILGINESTEKDILAVYSKATISRMKKQKTETRELCKQYIDKMIQYRNTVVKAVFKHKNDNTVKIPVAFQNIIANIQGQMHLNANSIVDITPMECFKLVESYYEKLKKLEYVQPNMLFELLYYYYLSPKDLLVNKRFHSKALVVLLETILLKYKQAIVHPGEMVGIIAGHSVGEPSTQMSAAYMERFKIIKLNKQSQEPEMISCKIGEFCDRIIEELPEYTFNTGHKDSVETILEPLEDEYYIVGVDEKEQTHWNKISHISRHPVNGDMIRVKTRSGRVVETTMSHSHLIRKDQTVKPITGSDMETGMRIPVAKHIDNAFIKDTIEIAGESYKLDHLFGWFIGAYLAEGSLTKKKGKMEAAGTICITNISEYYIENTKKFASVFNKTCTVREKPLHQILNSKKCYKSTDIKFTYKPLADLIMNTCGTGSFVKRVPDFAFLAPNEFKAGLLAGYFDGDGNFMCDKMHHQIRVCSRSDQLIKDISLLLNYFDIFAILNKEYKKGENNYHLTISPKYAKLYQTQIGSNLHSEKLQQLVDYIEREDIHTLREDIDKINGLGEVIASCGKKLELPGQSRNYGRWMKKDSIGRNTLQKYIKLFESHEKSATVAYELSVLRQAANANVIWDEIVEIEKYTPNQTEYVYDFTVPGNQTFMTDYGVIVHNTLNTFHLAGVASKSNVTRGVPRIEELLRLTKNPKNPSLTIHLKQLDETEKDRAIAYANMIEYTKLIDVVKSIKILFDPNDNTSFIEEDRLLIKQFYEFEKILKECAGYPQEDPDAPNKKSKWVIRMEMDPEVLLDKNITMDDIHYAIKNSSYGENIDCVFSDFNSDKLVFRIRLTNDDSKKKKVNVANTLDQSDEIYMLKNFQTAILNGIVLRGVPKIEKVIPRKLQNMVVMEEGKYVRKDLWVLDTKGTNLLNILGLEYIDTKRTYSNDVREVCDILGIEAARQMLFNELTEVMEFADAFINYHHLSLLCDRMTMTKDMVPIFRSGILSDDIGPIAKATFEVHTEVLLDAARHADFDHMRGVSASVMCGQYGNYGTGSFSLVLDMNQMRNLVDAAVETEIDDITQEIASKFKIRASQKSDSCGKKELEIQNNIVNIKRPEVMDICPDDEYDMGF